MNNSRNFTNYIPPRYQLLQFVSASLMIDIIYTAIVAISITYEPYMYQNFNYLWLLISISPIGIVLKCYVYIKLLQDDMIIIRTQLMLYIIPVVVYIICIALVVMLYKFASDQVVKVIISDKNAIIMLFYFPIVILNATCFFVSRNIIIKSQLSHFSEK